MRALIFLLFIYVSIVILKGRAGEFVGAVSEETGFFKWFGAVLLLYFLKDSLGDVTRGLWVLLIVGIGLVAAPNILKNLNKTVQNYV